MRRTRLPEMVAVRCRTIWRTIGRRISSRARNVTSSRARDVAGCVEPVGPDEVRVAEAELPGLGVHHRDEARLVAVADVRGQRVRRVVRAGYQRGLEQLAHGQPVARVEARRGLADLGRLRADGDDVVGLRVLERQQDRHQLRDARDRDAPLGCVGQQHLAGGAVLDHPGTARHVGRGSEDRGGEGEGRGDRDQAGLHGAAILGQRTRIRWPIVSEFGSTPGLSRSSASTVVSKRSATSLSVSPERSR